MKKIAPEVLREHRAHARGHFPFIRSRQRLERQFAIGNAQNIRFVRRPAYHANYRVELLSRRKSINQHLHLGEVVAAFALVDEALQLLETHKQRIEIVRGARQVAFVILGTAAGKTQPHECSARFGGVAFFLVEIIGQKVAALNLVASPIGSNRRLEDEIATGRLAFLDHLRGISHQSVGLGKICGYFLHRHVCRRRV